jgi:hypothetical protein
MSDVVELGLLLDIHAMGKRPSICKLDNQGNVPGMGDVLLCFWIPLAS